jgi:outer membrane translocation and assembly module TamA
VRVVVEEWPALRLRYGFQLREERPEDSLTGRELEPGVSADLTRRTLFGRALTIGGAAEYQRRERMGRLFFSTPTTFRLPVASSLVMERSRQSFAAAQLVSDQTSVSWEQRTRFGDHLTVSYAYRFARDHTFDTEPSQDPNFPDFDVTLNVARLTGTAAWDSRNDPANTVRGMLLSSSFEFAPEALGSDIRFLRYLAQGYVFRPYRDVVFASAARFGAVLGLEGQEVIPSERFYAGGGRTVRGVDEDSLGEIDFLGFPTGGRGLLVLNQEVRVPLYRWVGGVGFVDAGNVFPTVRSIDVGKLVGSVGGGLRISTPVGILRADVGRRMWGSADTPKSWHWIIGLGQTF